jgi:hypothetical protein
MNQSEGLSPELAAWLQARICEAVEQAVTPLRVQIEQVDDWANGVYVALSEVLVPLLKLQPELALYLQPLWADAAHRYAQLEHSVQADDFHETLELLEARKMLYEHLDLLKAWPQPGCN